MDRTDVNWRGYIPAITTPFDADGALDLAAFEKQLGWLIEQGMHGIILAGTTGEWFSMTPAERAELFAAGGKLAPADLPVIGGCNGYTAQEVISHARAAEAAGLAGILVTPPPYVVPNRRELVQFYRDVSDAVDLPICVYNWPRGCGVDMSPTCWPNWPNWTKWWRSRTPPATSGRSWRGCTPCPTGCGTSVSPPAPSAPTWPPWGGGTG